MELGRPQGQRKPRAVHSLLAAVLGFWRLAHVPPPAEANASSEWLEPVMRWTTVASATRGGQNSAKIPQQSRLRREIIAAARAG